MHDFTIEIYHQLLDALIKRGYTFQTFAEYLEKPVKKTIILRHDIDDRKENALIFAKIQHERGIKGTYYFRLVPQSYDEQIIKEISSLGHEIGYHYETMDTCKGDMIKAYMEFCMNLEKMRRIVPVQTICMHGSPRSPHDNKDLWKKYDYRRLNVIGEPYLDVKWEYVAYFTDTGRTWSGASVSMRDKVFGRHQFNFKSTQQIIDSVGKLPDSVMFTFHPQRWTDNSMLWFRELIFQNVKNVVKWFLID